MVTHVEEARELYARARQAKSESTRKRYEAQEYMERLRAFCDEYDIPLQVITEAEASRHGRSSHHPNIDNNS